MLPARRGKNGTFEISLKMTGPATAPPPPRGEQRDNSTQKGVRGGARRRRDGPRGTPATSPFARSYVEAFIPLLINYLSPFSGAPPPAGLAPPQRRHERRHHAGDHAQAQRPGVSVRYTRLSFDGRCAERAMIRPSTMSLRGVLHGCGRPGPGGATGALSPLGKRVRPAASPGRAAQRAWKYSFVFPLSPGTIARERPPRAAPGGFYPARPDGSAPTSGGNGWHGPEAPQRLP
jgi:hypothetical protein